MRKSAIKNDWSVAVMSSAFSWFSQPAVYEIPSGKLYDSANSISFGCISLGSVQGSKSEFAQIVIFPSSRDIDESPGSNENVA